MPALQILVINHPESVHDRQNRKNDPYTRNDHEAQNEIDDADEERAFDIVGNGCHIAFSCFRVCRAGGVQKTASRSFPDLAGNGGISRMTQAVARRLHLENIPFPTANGTRLQCRVAGWSLGEFVGVSLIVVKSLRGVNAL